VQPQPQPGPITNGGFEELDLDGWAVDWERVGEQVSLTKDAHSGKNAALLRRTQKAIDDNRETGLNRTWQAHSGEQGAMLAERKGGVKFWYKVPKAPAGAQIRLNMIPMSSDPLENTGSARQWYGVPAEHFGDGQWHEGMTAYDFTENEKCKWVHVSPRIRAEKPVEWIIDDITWVRSVGALASVVKMDLREVTGQEGRQCEISAVVKNTGDQPLRGSAELRLPDYLEAAEPGRTQEVGPLPPQDTTIVKWRVSGLRDRVDVIGLRVTGGAVPASASLKLAPELSEVWLEAEQFVLWPRRETRVSLVVANEGTAAARDVRASLDLPGEAEAVGRTTGVLDLALPKVRSRLDFQLKAQKQTPSARVAGMWASGTGEAGHAETHLVIGAPPPRPDAEPGDAARVATGSFEILFPRSEFGYGIGWIFTRPGGELVGAMPYLGRAVLAGREDKPIALYADRFGAKAPLDPLGASGKNIRKAGKRGLTFAIESDELRRGGLRGPVRVSLVAVGEAGAVRTQSVLRPLARTITYQISCAAPRQPALLALEGPMVCAGEGAFGGRQDEALYPGLEWLVPGEQSSSTLDIEPDHPHRLRYVAHPHMVTIPLMAVRHASTSVGLLWHARSAWNAGRSREGLEPDRSDTDRPSAIFASPDRFDGHASHAMGLFVPTVPEYVEPNARAARTPWPAAGAKAGDVRLVSAIYVNPESDTVMDAMRAWFDIYGIVAPSDLPHAVSPPPTKTLVFQPRFRGYGLPLDATTAGRRGNWREASREQWIDEIEWSMHAYLETLWDDEEQAWWNFLGGPGINRRTGPHGSYLYDCILAARLTDDEDLRGRLAERIALVRELYPYVTPQAEDMGFNFGHPLRSLLGQSEQAARLINSQDADGGWRFHPYIAKGGVFEGRDYSELGYEGQQAVGLVARKAWTMLRVARMTGDERAFEAGVKALGYMEEFVVPRAAQVWEVPVHTPDILASSDACEAYLEAYRITGDRQYLQRAVYWEETGLPFLYQWDVDAFPWMRYASIPVFGATWYKGSWFGRAVQWNGLRWAFAALKLAEVDDTYPWRMLAAGVTVSAIYQQGEDKEELALWPDSVDIMNAKRAAWLFAPRRILQNVYKLAGHEPEPVTARVEAPGGTILINACGETSAPHVRAGELTFTVTARAPLATRVVVCGVSEPETIKVNGSQLARQDPLPAGEVAGWTYHKAYGILEISPGKPGKLALQVSPAAYRPCRLAPSRARRLAFEFDRGDGGWLPAHDLREFSVAGGMLRTHATGGDPYMVRANCRIAGDGVAQVRVRMAVSAGTGAQFFWTTEDSPTMAEDKSVSIGIQGDGQPHEYYFEVGKHAMWRGKTVTSIRLDPMVGAEEADITIDFIRGEA
jgi:hypothetical protein